MKKDMAVDTSVSNSHAESPLSLISPITKTPKMARFESPPSPSSASDHSEITLESSIGGSSVVSISQLSTTGPPSIPIPSAHVNNPRLRELLYPTENYQRSRRQVYQVELDSIDHAMMDQNEIFGGFTVQQITQTFHFISNNPKDKGFIGFSNEDFDSAFRKVKRARKQRSMEEEARKFMKTFRFLLQLSKKSPEQWFVETDTTPDCKLSWSEFEAGMHKLCTDLGGAMFSKNGLTSMLRYMDPFCLGELTAPEVKAAFKRIKLPSQSVVILTEAGDVFSFLQHFIKQRAVRVNDLFNSLDFARRKVINLKTFCIGIERLQGLLISGGLTIQKVLDKTSRPVVNVFDPIKGDGRGISFSLEQDKSGTISFSRASSNGSCHHHDSCSDKYLAPSALLRSSSELEPIAEMPRGHHKKEKKKMKAGVPHSNTRSIPIDTEALAERKRLLNGVHLPKLPPPRKVNYNEIVQKNVQKFDPWIKHFDSTMKTGLILYAES